MQHDDMINMQLPQTNKLFGGTFHIPRWASKSHGVFVHAAKSEPFGLCLLEAAASGLPVVASLSGGPGQIIQSFLAFLPSQQIFFSNGNGSNPGFVKRSTCFFFFGFFHLSERVQRYTHAPPQKKNSHFC